MKDFVLFVFEKTRFCDTCVFNPVFQILSGVRLCVLPQPTISVRLDHPHTEGTNSNHVTDSRPSRSIAGEGIQVMARARNYPGYIFFMCSFTTLCVLILQIHELSMLIWELF